MTEFWEENFKTKQKMWGESPAPAAAIICEYFKERQVESVLIPGIGYGRNAVPFLGADMKVTGIEISETAIAIAKQEMKIEGDIHHGSVTEMPFDNEKYDGIFCYAVIHLLAEDERKKLIADCYRQLTDAGTMVFVAVSTKAPSYKKGTEISKNRFAQHNGAEIYFYDENAIREEFSDYGLIEIREVTEKTGANEMKFLMAICTKK